MKLKTFYSEECVNDEFVLNGQEITHAIKVYRLQNGDKINVICGDDNVYTCKISEIKDNVKAKIIHKERNLSNPKVSLTVYQCNLKADKMEYLIQKLTELGATKFIPVKSENIVKTDCKLQRLEKIAKESLKQSGRSKSIEIGDMIAFKKMLEEIKNYNKFFVAHEKEKITSIAGAMSNIIGQNCAILIGPEGGLSDNEVKLCLQYGAVIIGLGERILRAETACVAIASVVLFNQGEFNL